MVELKAFQISDKKISLQGDLALKPGLLHISFSLKDPQKQILQSLTTGLWSEQNSLRAHELWKYTCFEVFFAESNKESYWELNLSPLGKWNCYKFSSYRNPSPPQEAKEFSLLSLTTTEDSLHCNLEFTQKLKNIDASLCAVIKTTDSTIYFSTKHVGEKADFHLKESFAIHRGLP